MMHKRTLEEQCERKQSDIGKVNELLDTELHEVEIYENMMHRTKEDYLLMREKVREILKIDQGLDKRIYYGLIVEKYAVNSKVEVEAEMQQVVTGINEEKERRNKQMRDLVEEHKEIQHQIAKQRRHRNNREKREELTQLKIARLRKNIAKLKKRQHVFLQI